MSILLLSLLVSLAINVAMFIPAFVFKTDKITDISYAVTFIVVAVAGYVASIQKPLHSIVLLLVLMWALRLGIFLFIRINKMGKDKRFDGMRDKFFPFLRFWLLQGATVFIVMLAPLSAFSEETATVTMLTVFGVAIFIVGLALEATADFQKYAFNNNHANKDRWIDVGVWRISRHPNYLGEMLVWIGMYLVVFSSLSGNRLLLALASPLYIILLLLFVSGIPLLEKAADKKWEDVAEYRHYKNKVPVLVPRLRSVKRLFHK